MPERLGPAAADLNEIPPPASRGPQPRSAADESAPVVRLTLDLWTTDDVEPGEPTASMVIVIDGRGQLRESSGERAAITPAQLDEIIIALIRARSRSRRHLEILTHHEAPRPHGLA
jgi:hypothetical protein